MHLRPKPSSYSWKCLGVEYSLYKGPFSFLFHTYILPEMSVVTSAAWFHIAMSSWVVITFGFRLIQKVADDALNIIYKLQVDEHHCAFSPGIQNCPVSDNMLWQICRCLRGPSQNEGLKVKCLKEKLFQEHPVNTPYMTQRFYNYEKKLIQITIAYLTAICIKLLCRFKKKENHYFFLIVLHFLNSLLTFSVRRSYPLYIVFICVAFQ